jgi:hypothetical protein
MQERDKSNQIGRKAKHVLRRVKAKYMESNTIEYEGILLKKVNSAVIDHKLTTYFKCRNMKTPYRIIGVCNFSSRISNFPKNLEMEVLAEHNSNCSYFKEAGGHIPSAPPYVHKPNKKPKKIAKVQKAVYFSSSEENNSDEDKIKSNIKIPPHLPNNSDLRNVEVYVQLFSEEDLVKEQELFYMNPTILI